MATTVKDLRSTLESEAKNLTKQRDRLRSELDKVEAQLTARLEAAANLGRIRPMGSVATAKAAPKASTTAASKTATRTTTKTAAKATAKPAKRATRAAAKKTTTAKTAKTASAATRSGASRATTAVKPAKKAPTKKAVAKKAAATRPAGRRTTKAATAGGRTVRTHLRDDIANVLERSKVSMNVREIVEALGESPTKSRLESVRTSAEGLVSAGRAKKPKRGQFAGK